MGKIVQGVVGGVLIALSFVPGLQALAPIGWSSLTIRDERGRVWIARGARERK